MRMRTLCCFLLLLLAAGAPAGAAGLRQESEEVTVNGKTLKRINRYLDFDDDTLLRYRTTHDPADGTLHTTRWGDFFFGLDFGRHGNGSWDGWNFLQVTSLEGKRPVNVISRSLPDSVSLLALAGEQLADLTWKDGEQRSLHLQIRKFSHYPDYLFFRVRLQGSGWQSPEVSVAAYPGNSDQPPERERWAAIREESFPLAAAAREILPQSDGLALFNKYRYAEFGNLLVFDHRSVSSLLLPKTNYHVRVIMRPRDPAEFCFALSFFKEKPAAEIVERFLNEEADAASAFLRNINWQPELDPQPLDRLRRLIGQIIDELPETDPDRPQFRAASDRLGSQAATALGARDAAALAVAQSDMQALFETLVARGLQRFR